MKKALVLTLFIVTLLVVSKPVLGLPITGTFRPVNTGPIQVSNPFPIDTSNNVSLQPTLRITINSSTNSSMTLSWFYGMNSSSTDALLGSTGSLYNGTYFQSFPYVTNHRTTYYWRVHVTDGVTHINQTFNFTSKPLVEGSGAYAGYTVVGLAGLFGIIGLIAVIKKKKKEEKEEI